MNLSRRLFLGGVATVLSATLVNTSDDLPVLWGDGEHDDGPALNAWLRGEPIRIRHERIGIVGERHMIVGASLATSEPIALNGVVRLELRDFSLKVLDGFRGAGLIEVSGDQRQELALHDGRIDTPPGVSLLCVRDAPAPVGRWYGWENLRVEGRA